MKPASFTYESGAKALGFRSVFPLKEARRKRLLRVKRVGHRTVLIPRQELERFGKLRGLTLID